jgi:hypothetical protein
MSMNKSNDTIGNRPRDLLVCSALPQATVPPRAAIVEQYRTQMKLWRMHILCWKPKAASTHPEYVTHFFSTAAIVARARLLVMFYVCFLSCLQLILQRCP